MQDKTNPRADTGAGAAAPAGKALFTPYQKLVIAILAFIQFTVYLDFMILSPLGAILLRALDITTAQFGLLVSSYALSAGISSLLTAGFADKFDRKRLMLVFYAGFVLGTLFCGLAPDYPTLLAARIFTGIFGGVITSISFAIIADLFAYQVRGRVIGIVQTAFAASNVLGIPLGLWLATHLGWRTPFLLIVGISIPMGLLMAFRLRKVDAHLKNPSGLNALGRLFGALAQRRYAWAFAATTLLATGGYMLMPFGSAFLVENLGIRLDLVPWIYGASGMTTLFAGPLLGRLSDAIGKYPMFWASSLLGMAIVVVYCRLGLSPLWLAIAFNVVLFLAITGRMIASQALVSAVPDPQDRGAFMSINASLQHFSGSVASALAGLIVFQAADGKLVRYDTLGLVVAAAMGVTILLMFRIHREVRRKMAAQGGAAPVGPAR